MHTFRTLMCSVYHIHVVLYTHQAATLLATVQPRCSTAVQRSSALVQTLTARPVVTTTTAKQVLIWVCTVTESPPAKGLSILCNKGYSGNIHINTVLNATHARYLHTI